MPTISRAAESVAEEQLHPHRVGEEGINQFARKRTFAQLELLWSSRNLLFRWAASGLIVGTLAAFLIPSRYQSTTQLMPPDSQSGNTLALLAGLAGKEGSNNLGAMAGDLLGVKSTGDLFVGVLRSRTVQDGIVQRFDLRKVYGVRLEMQAREKLSDRTSVSEDRKSGIIAVQVSDRDPRRAAAIAAAYVEELDKLMALLTTSSAHRERVFLEGRLKSVNVELESAEKDLSQFASKNTTIDVNEQAKAMVQSTAILEGQLIGAQSELEGLKQIYSDENVRVRSTAARIEELQKQLRKMAGKQGGDASNDAATSDQPYPSLRELPILGVPYAELFRRLRVEEAVFETLTKQYEIAKVQEAKEIPTVKVLDVADVPERRSFPPRLLIIFLGIAGGFILSCVRVIGEARWQEIDPQDEGRIFGERLVRGVRTRLPRIARNGFRQHESEESVQDQSSRNEDS